MSNTQDDGSTEKDDLSEGFVDRLTDGGINRILRGYDLYISIAVTLAFYLVSRYSDISLINISFVNHGTQLAISLTAFILAALSVLIAFSDEKFLGLLKDLQIYNTLVFTFEFSVYLALTTAVIGIITGAYAPVLQELGIFSQAFLLYLFFFTYMVLAAADLVASVVSIGERKAKLAILSSGDEN